jgi:hypothetical protein
MQHDQHNRLTDILALKKEIEDLLYEIIEKPSR